MAAKRNIREYAEAIRIPALDALILSELDSVADIRSRPVPEAIVRECHAFFLAALAC